VFLGGSSDIERRNVNKLASNTDVALTDQDTGVVDGLGQTLLVNLGLETAFQQLLGCQLKNGIQLKFVISEQSIPAHAAKHSGTLEDSGGILGLQCQQSTSGLSQLSQSILNSPDLTLTAESILSDEFKFSIQAFLFVRSARRLERLAI
jgi:hypothetical protein